MASGERGYDGTNATPQFILGEQEEYVRACRPLAQTRQGEVKAACIEPVDLGEAEERPRKTQAGDGPVSESL